jgi:uncharacterized membrane protein YbhN (UPF0104 family)
VNGQRRPAFLRWAGPVISVLSLSGVAVWASRQSPPQLPSGGPELVAFAAALSLYAAATALRGERWLRILRRTGGRGARADAYGLTVVGYMGNNVLPLRGGDAIRTLFGAERFATPYRLLIGTLIAERILDAACVIAIFATVALFVLPGVAVPDIDGLWPALAALVILGLAGGALGVAARRRGNRAARLIGFLSPMTAATRGLRGDYGLAMATATVAIWGLEAATFYAVADASGVGMTPLEAVYLVGLTAVLVLIPSGPGYLGTLDAAVIFGVEAIGGTGSEALSFLLVLRFVYFVPLTVMGLILVLTRYGGFGSLRGGLGGPRPQPVSSGGGA